MTQASLYLREIAARIAEAYCTLPGAAAAMLTGSAALGISDYYSDVDMSIYYDETLPPETEFRAVERQLLGVTDLLWTLGERESGGVAYAFSLGGVECQVVHATVANIEHDVQAVLSATEVKSPLQKVCPTACRCMEKV